MLLYITKTQLEVLYDALLKTALSQKKATRYVDETVKYKNGLIGIKTNLIELSQAETSTARAELIAKIKNAFSSKPQPMLELKVITETIYEEFDKACTSVIYEGKRYKEAHIDAYTVLALLKRDLVNKISDLTFASSTEI